MREFYVVINYFRIISMEKHDDELSPNGKIALLRQECLRGITIKYEYKISSKSKTKVLLSIIYSFFAR